MTHLQWPSIRRVLCLGAHADDIEIGCGGTVLRLIKEHPNIEFHWVVFSAAGERAAEAYSAAEHFLDGAHTANVVVKDFRDSYFPYIGATIKDFVHDLADHVSPDLVFTHCRHDMHQDHRLLSELTRNAFRNQLIVEYEIPKYDGDLTSPNFLVTLDRELCEKKVQLIMERFPSQTSRRWFSDDTFWSLLRLRGVESNSPSGFAEGFHTAKLVL